MHESSGVNVDSSVSTPLPSSPQSNKHRTPGDGSKGLSVSTPVGCVRWFFVGLSCFAMFFTALNLTLHDMISEHGHGTSEAPSKLSDVRNFVMNKIAAERKFVKDEVLWVGHLLAEELNQLRDSGLERAGMSTVRAVCYVVWCVTA